MDDLKHYFENERKEIACQIAAYAQTEGLPAKELYNGMQPIMGNVLSVCEMFATYRYLLKSFKPGDDAASVMADIVNGRQTADAVLKEYNKINMQQLRKEPLALKQFMEEIYRRLQPLSYLKLRPVAAVTQEAPSYNKDALTLIGHHIVRLPTPADLNELVDPLEKARKFNNTKATTDLVDSLQHALHTMRDVRMDMDRIIQRSFTATQLWLEDILNKYNLIVANKASIKERLRVLEVHNRITQLRGTHELKETNACASIYKVAEQLKEACKESTKSFLSQHWEGVISVTEEIRRFGDDMKAFTATYLPHFTPLHEWIEQNILIEHKKQEQTPLCESVLQALQEARKTWKAYKKEMIEAEQIVLAHTKEPETVLGTVQSFVRRHWPEHVTGGTVGMGIGAIGFASALHPMSLALVVLGSTVAGLGAGTGVAVTREYLQPPSSPNDQSSEFERLLSGDEETPVNELHLTSDPINLERECEARHLIPESEQATEEENGLLSLSLSLTLPVLNMPSLPFWRAKHSPLLVEDACDKLEPPRLHPN
ncbi:MAG TPA: hypothetical protein VHA52_13325, partial [Candidatus Babeliaceae bacterium]|nr:hypothetical protein [Candidatus Babeliaceae bacterium]